MKKEDKFLKKKIGKYDGAPPQHVFDDIQEACVNHWIENFSDEHGYVTGKVNRVRSFRNIGHEFTFMVGMFDHGNMMQAMSRMKHESKVWIVKIVLKRHQDKMRDIMSSNVFDV